MTQQFPLFSIICLSFTFYTNIQDLLALTVTSDLICLYNCAVNPECQGCKFLEDTPTDNCELVLHFKEYVYSVQPIWLVAKDIEPSPTLSIVSATRVHGAELAGQAASAGFDVQLQLPQEVLFLKLVNASMRIKKAQYECARHGGVLPLEDSDDFIDGMSSLVGDPVSTRFTSLVREFGLEPNQPHLVWQNGYVETTVLDGSQPKYTTWNHRHFVVNPATKTYESVADSTVKSNFYCQYLGQNLALNKATYVSSVNSRLDPGPGVVDGVIDDNFWQINVTSTVRNHWFAVDLGGTYRVNRLLFVTRLISYGDRSRDMRVWIGDVVPPADQDLNHTMYKLCGGYPYVHSHDYLSGILCVSRHFGSVVILENGYQAGVNTILHITELLIF